MMTPEQVRLLRAVIEDGFDQVPSLKETLVEQAIFLHHIERILQLSENPESVLHSFQALLQVVFQEKSPS